MELAGTSGPPSGPPFSCLSRVVSAPCSGALGTVEQSALLPRADFPSGPPSFLLLFLLRFLHLSLLLLQLRRVTWSTAAESVAARGPGCLGGVGRVQVFLKRVFWAQELSCPAPGGSQVPFLGPCSRGTLREPP